MTVNIGIHLRFGDAYVSIRPTDGPLFEIDITDVIGNPVSEDEQERALADLQTHFIDKLREQIYQRRKNKPRRK